MIDVAVKVVKIVVERKAGRERGGGPQVRNNNDNDNTV